VQLKEIERIGTKSKFINPKLKTINDASFKLKEENVSDMFFGRPISILIILANQVGNFKLTNLKLQIYKLRLNPNKRCVPLLPTSMVSSDDDVIIASTRP
jgi:hypothetical protein